MSEHEMSRRGFVAMSGAAGMAGALAIAGARQAKAAEEAGTAPSFMAKPDAIADVAEQHDYDLVVVGAGCAGMGAVISAVKAGAKVAVLEKFPQPLSQGHGASGIDMDVSDEAAVQYLVNKHFEANAYRPVREVVETWAHRSGEALKALVDFSADSATPFIVSDTGDDESIGAREPVQYPGTDLSCQLFWVVPSSGSFTNGIADLAEVAASKGVDFYFECPGKQLVQDADGRVTGVVAQSADGAYIQLNASKGVILSAGDYQNDEEMVAYYLPDVADCIRKQQGKTGDGIKMAIWAGGVMEPWGHTKMCHDYGSGPMGDEFFLCTDMHGKRTFSEDEYLFLRETFFRLSGGSGEYAQVFDSNYEEQVRGWGGEPVPADQFPRYLEEDEGYQGRGHMFKADTIEELGQKLGIDDVDAFAATVARYNELAAAGVDEDLGKDPKYLKPIDTPPFYGVHRNCGITAITSGVLTDGSQRVLDGAGQPIPGLYAAGNTAGGFYGAVDYPLYAISGISVGRAVTGGYVAAEAALAE